MRESLAESYPGVARFVGEEGFRELSRRYAASVPLSSYNLNDAGERMAAFLRRGDFLLQALPFLADLAQLEWCVACAFHAWQQTPFVPRTLGWSADEWARAILHFQPAVATLSSPWSILDLWTARDVPPDRIDIDSHNHPQSVVIRRIGLTVRVESVCVDESRVLHLLLQGLSLGDALASVATVGRDFDAVLAWFRRWVNADMIIGASLPNPALAA